MPEPKEFIIYCITSPSGKKYVGQTTSLTKRIWEHKNAKGNCAALYEAIKKYGWENMVFEVLDDSASSKEELNVLEIYYMEKMSSLKPNGYNLKTGGDSGQHNDSTKEILAEQQRQRFSDPNARKHMSQKTTEFFENPENRKHMSEIGKARSSDPEWKDAHSSKIKDNWDDEKKRSEFVKSMQKGFNGYYVTEISTGETIFITNLRQFASEKGLHQGHLTDVANGKLKKHKGYTVRKNYVNEE